MIGKRILFFPLSLLNSQELQHEKSMVENKVSKKKQIPEIETASWFELLDLDVPETNIPINMSVIWANTIPFLFKIVYG